MKLKLHEEFKLYETMWDDGSIDEAEVDACLARTIEATKYNGKYPEEMSVYIKLSKEDLKKALKLGGYATFQTPKDMPIPAQLVDGICLEFIYDDYSSSLNLSLSGYRDGFESVNDYFDDIPFIGFLDVIETFTTEQEARDYFKKNIEPNAEKLALRILNSSWRESGYTDYAGITDYEA